MHAEVVSDGDAALAAMADAPPDLVLLDVVLPGACGFEICGRLKADPLTALIPVVLVTALEDRRAACAASRPAPTISSRSRCTARSWWRAMKTLRRLHETRRELEARRLAAEVERKEALRKAFSRYISPRLAERIIGAAGRARPSGPTPSAPTWWCCSRTCAASRGSPRRIGVRQRGRHAERVLLGAHRGGLPARRHHLQHGGRQPAGRLQRALPAARRRGARLAHRAGHGVALRAGAPREWRARFGVATGVGIGIAAARRSSATSARRTS